MKAGVLIAGSLAWDLLQLRVEWRASRLRMNDGLPVSAPIRYGRRSGKRNDTFTMVFSQTCIDGGHPTGTGLAVPFVDVFHSLNDLLDEASRLWQVEAERSAPDHRINAPWGSVGLLVNPSFDLPEDFRDAWATRVGSMSRYGELDLATGEGRFLDPESGLVECPWPTVRESGEPLDFDAVLLTATAPTITCGEFPDPQTVADAWNLHPEEASYFDRNREVGITTAFDNEILALRSSQQPES